MPKLRNHTIAMTEHISARLPTGTLDRIERAGGGERQKGARIVIQAGLDFIEGTAAATLPNDRRLTDADVQALVAEMAPIVSDAIAYSLALREDVGPTPAPAAGPAPAPPPTPAASPRPPATALARPTAQRMPPGWTPG